MLYTIPVGYARADDTLLLGTESRWKQNLRGGARVSVHLVGRERTGRAEVIDDEAGMIEAYRTMLRLAPDYGRAIALARPERRTEPGGCYPGPAGGTRGDPDSAR